MKKWTIIPTLLLWCQFGMAQYVTNIFEQNVESNLQDIHMEEIYMDNSSSTYLIWTPTTLDKERMGADVQEQILVLSGEAIFTFSDKKLKAKAGSYFVIPPNTPHRITVTGEEPLKLFVTQKAN